MKNIITLLIAFYSLTLLSQDGELDTSFNPITNIETYINAIAEQVDHKIIIGGGFGSVVRLNEDGSIDTSFDASTSYFGSVNYIAIQQDNKIVVAGGGSSYVRRLNLDGSIDATFNFPLNNSISIINKIEILNNGKIIIAGVFDSIDDIPIEAAARLNPDGSLDTTFNLNLAPVSSIRDLVVQADGKIIITGQNDESNQYKLFRRFFPDGAFDPSFNGDESHYIYDIKIQQDGKIMVSGPLQEYHNVERNGVARLNMDGSLDTSFNSYNLPQNGTYYTIFDVTLLNDGKYFINGSFEFYNDVSSRFIAKINSDGTIDSSFNIGTGPNEFVREVYFQEDEKIVIVGSFTAYNGTPINRIARLNNNLLSTNDNLFTEAFKLYPNPVNNNLNVEFTKNINTDLTITILTVTGQVIKSETLNKNKTIDLSFLANGIYLVKIENEIQSYIYKIIKL